jgi:serine O-acetyltransferase
LERENIVHLDLPNPVIREEVKEFTKDLFYGVFDQRYFSKKKHRINDRFLSILNEISPEINYQWSDFEDQLSKIKWIVLEDADFIYKNDPAAHSLKEVILAYPGFYAIVIHRISHVLFKNNCIVFSRLMSEYVHSKTGIDIHPGATIGSPFFIDHGTGIVIGETTVIEGNVKIFQGVTLGGNSVRKAHESIKRHPTVRENVTIYANATILGGEIEIGANSTIGANVSIAESIPENSLVIFKSAVQILKKRK